MISVQTHKKQRKYQEEHCRNIFHLFTVTVDSDLTSSFGSILSLSRRVTFTNQNSPSIYIFTFPHPISIAVHIYLN